MGLRMSAGRMVGRDGELGRLLALLDDAEAGRAVAALVSGDAGVGKSRLVSEVTRLAASRGFTVLSGQCAELGDSVPYLPFADALRGAAESAGGPRRAVKAPAGPGPAAARRRRGAASPTPTGPGWPASRCSAPCSACWPSWPRPRPVLLVLEDLHWADASTRDLLTFLSRMLHRRTGRHDRHLPDRRPAPPPPAAAGGGRAAPAAQRRRGRAGPAGPAGAGRAPVAARRPAGTSPPPAQRHRGPGRGQRLLRRGAAGRAPSRRGRRRTAHCRPGWPPCC